MTAQELIDYLSKLPPGTPVVKLHDWSYRPVRLETAKMHRMDESQFTRLRNEHEELCNNTTVVVIQ